MWDKEKEIETDRQRSTELIPFFIQFILLIAAIDTIKYVHIVYSNLGVLAYTFKLVWLFYAMNE